MLSGSNGSLGLDNGSVVCPNKICTLYGPYGPPLFIVSMHANHRMRNLKVDLKQFGIEPGPKLNALATRPLLCPLPIRWGVGWGCYRTHYGKTNHNPSCSNDAYSADRGRPTQPRSIIAITDSLLLSAELQVIFDQRILVLVD